MFMKEVVEIPPYQYFFPKLSVEYSNIYELLNTCYKWLALHVNRH